MTKPGGHPTGLKWAFVKQKTTILGKLMAQGDLHRSGNTGWIVMIVALKCWEGQEGALEGEGPEIVHSSIFSHPGAHPNWNRNQCKIVTMSTLHKIQP